MSGYPVWCGRNGNSYKESDAFGFSPGRGVATNREHLNPPPSPPPAPNPHECCQSFKLPPAVLILQIHHLVYQFLSLRVISQLLTLGILYFGLSEHVSVYRYWLLGGRASLNYFSTVDPFVKSGVGWGGGGVSSQNNAFKCIK